MTLKVVDFEPQHVRAVMAAADFNHAGQLQPHLDMLRACGAKTIMCEGEPIMCGGVIPQGASRALAWAFFSQGAAPHMLGITRLTRKFLAGIDGRVDATVVSDFDNGRRWADLIGFKQYALLPQWGPDGEDHIGYVKYNGVH